MLYDTGRNARLQKKLIQLSFLQLDSGTGS
jgi:hypothetical protein